MLFELINIILDIIKILLAFITLIHILLFFNCGEIKFRPYTEISECTIKYKYSIIGCAIYQLCDIYHRVIFYIYLNNKKYKIF